MLHHFIIGWFSFLEHWGYIGVFVLMAMESSIIPVPSEVVIPPAAFWAAQGRMDLTAVILSATAGSYFGSALSYVLCRLLGAPFLEKYGKFFLLTSKKRIAMEKWTQKWGFWGIFWARLLPVVRHLISMPAGALKMPFVSFSIATTIGAFIWCALLAWIGAKILGDNPEFLNSPEQMIHTIKGQSTQILLVILLLMIGNILTLALFRKKTNNS